MADYQNYRDLTKAVQLMPPADNFFVKNIFKKKETAHTDTVVISSEDNYTQGVASLASKEAPAKVLKKIGGKTRYLYLAETHEKYNFTTEEFALMKALEGTLLTGTDNRLTAWNEHILKHAKVLKDRAERRLEMFAAQAISTGKIDITEDGVSYDADFGFVENTHYFDVAGDYFSVDTKDPVKNLRTWIKSVKRKSGLNDIVVIMGEAAADLYIGHKLVKSGLETLNFQIGQMTPFAQLSGYGADIIHRLPSGTPVYDYKNVYKNASAVVTDMVDPKLCIVMALSGDYRLYEGKILKFKANSTDIDTSAVGMLAEMHQNQDRTAVQMSLRWKGMPAILNPASIEVHKVVAG